MLRHCLGWLRVCAAAVLFITSPMFLLVACADEGTLVDSEQTPSQRQAKLKKIMVGPRADTGTAQAVLVPRADLVHTAQLWPTNQQGQLVGKGDPQKQTEQAVENLTAVLADAAANLSDLVKLNVYLASTDDASAVQQTLPRLLSGKAQPAICYMTGNLRMSDALVALDGVAAVQADTSQTKVRRLRSERAFAASKESAQTAVLPAGGRVYVSGQAEPGELPEAVRKTLESLKRTLDHLGLDLSHVVQVKSFLTPISSAPEVEKQIVAFFGGLSPPLVFVEWESNLPIEIELIAADKPVANANAALPTIEFITPPDLKPSPVFCRVTRVRDEETIYIAGLYGSPGTNSEKQIRDIFAELKNLLGETGSDLRHLAKATYYVSTDDVSAKLGQIRPEFYDPQRPPAASKAKVRGVGATDRTITLDMIAVPVRKAN
jgi:enamine deaminase RidA (YjgF/YER057c/UK114 family)